MPYNDRLQPFGPDGPGEPIRPEMITRQLELKQIGGMQRFGAQFAHDLTIEQRVDVVANAIDYVFRTHVLAERVGNEELSKEFEVVARRPLRSYLNWLVVISYVTVAAMLAMTAFLGVDIAYAIGASWIACWTLVYRFALPKDITVRHTGVVTVEADYWTHFPESSIVVDSRMGRAIRFTEYRNPRLHFDNEEEGRDAEPF